MKFRNIASKFAPGVLLSGVGIGSAFAEVPASVSTAISGAQADAVTVAGLMIGVVAALLAFKYIRKQMH